MPPAGVLECKSQRNAGLPPRYIPVQSKEDINPRHSQTLGASTSPTSQIAMDTDQVSASGRMQQEMMPLNEATKGNKRLFSEAYDNSEHSPLEGHSQSAPNTAEKRRRASLWPFHGKDHVDFNVEKRRGRRPGGSGTGKRTPKRDGRSSRFVEGSMNNRASRKPPQEYFAGYESHSQSETGESAYASRHSRQPSRAAIMLKDEPEMDSEPNRQSGIFRFGLKLAATFNPSNWKIWQKEKPAEDNSAAERLKADADFKRAYEEVKKRGFIQGSRPGAMALAKRSEKQCNIGNASDIIMEDAAQASTEAAHGEGQDFRTTGQRNSVDHPNVKPPISQSELENKYQRPFPRAPIKLPAVTPEDSVSNYSPSSTSPRRGTSRLLEGAFNDDPSRPTRGRIDSQPLPEGRRTPLARKDMEKQLNLVKKVSTLEFKLRAAQEELALSMGTRLPPKKTRIGIDYDAIHAIQLQKQQEGGAQNPASTKSGLIQSRSKSSERSVTGERTGPNLEQDGSSNYSSRAPAVDKLVSDSPVAMALSVTALPLPGTVGTQSFSSSPHGHARSTAQQKDSTNEIEGEQKRQHHVGSPPKIKKRLEADRPYRPSQDSDEESGGDADSMTTRTATVTRVKSGPRKRSVEVVVLPEAISKMRSMRGRVETEERRGRPLRRAGDNDNEITVAPDLSVVNNRTPSEASVKSTRSSRIPRPLSRDATPVRVIHEKAPPVPPIPIKQLEQVCLIPKRSGSTKSLKDAANKHAMHHTGHVLKTPPPKKDARGTRETTPTQRQERRKPAVGVPRKANGSRERGKSPFNEKTRGLTKSASTRGGLHQMEREMSPSKESAFEWGPDVF